jgi:8-oxo-dGTP pyrophosphatase MutT (NUDIX family)
VTAARPPRESATVIPLRDGEAGLEVFMLRRHLNSDFIGGAYVFPGGSLDAADCEAAILDRYGGLSPARAGELLGIEPARAIGHWGCAVRETFEEAGVMLAYRDGALVPMRDDASRAHWQEQRRRLLDGELSWMDLLVAERLTLALDQVLYYAHWITPEASPKRFTTRFFVARVPESQTPLPDLREVDHGVWLSPEEALARHARGELPMIFPTIRTLEELSAFPSAEAAMRACHGKVVEGRMPKIVEVDGRHVLLLPGDPGYEAAGLPPESFNPWRV